MGGNGFVVLVPFTTGVLREVDDIAFLEIICGCTSDAVTSFVSYRWSSRSIGHALNRPNIGIFRNCRQGMYMMSLNGDDIDKT